MARTFFPLGGENIEIHQDYTPSPSPGSWFFPSLDQSTLSLTATQVLLIARDSIRGVLPLFYAPIGRAGAHRKNLSSENFFFPQEFAFLLVKFLADAAAGGRAHRCAFNSLFCFFRKSRSFPSSSPATNFLHRRVFSTPSGAVEGAGRRLGYTHWALPLSPPN